MRTGQDPSTSSKPSEERMSSRLSCPILRLILIDSRPNTTWFSETNGEQTSNLEEMRQLLEKKKLSSKLLRKKVTKLSDKATGETLHNRVVNCGESEGDRCLCSGMVFYGEKYDREDTTKDKALSFTEMISFPYKVKDQTHGGIMILCSL